MLLQVLSFGTNWWARFGRDSNDPYRYTRHAAYYNSAGIRCGNKIRRHWIVPGLIRFNGAGDFNPHLPNRSLGQMFFASELEYRFGGNRLLIKNRAHTTAIPDWYLVAVSRDIHGRIPFHSQHWKSENTQVIAASQLRDRQEVLLLMQPSDWIETACGVWQLSVSDCVRSGAELMLFGGQASSRS